MNNDKYIGIFDSGFGGLSVLKYAKALMPNENFIYMADSKNAPFGLKNTNELKVIASNIVEKLLTYDLKEIIIACGTMSTNLYEYLTSKYPNVHFIGTYPDFEHILKSGLEVSHNSIHASLNDGISIKRKTLKILIISTLATTKSKYIRNKITKYNQLFDIYAEPADQIVKYVENDELDSFSCKTYLNDLFSSYKDSDYLVLGCTHFPFAEKQIKMCIGNKVNIIDGCEVAAKKAYEYLAKNSLQNDNEIDGIIKILDTTIDDKRKEIYNKLLDINNAKYNIEFLKII